MRKEDFIIGGLVLGLMGMVGGTSYFAFQSAKKKMNPAVSRIEKLVTVKGTPIGVNTGGGDSIVKLSFGVLEEGKKEPLLCYGMTSSGGQRYTDVAALIEAEEQDLDNEQIEVTGRYVDLGYGKNALEITSVKVNGYNIVLDEEKK